MIIVENCFIINFSQQIIQYIYFLFHYLLVGTKLLCSMIVYLHTVFSVTSIKLLLTSQLEKATIKSFQFQIVENKLKKSVHVYQTIYN